MFVGTVVVTLENIVLNVHFAVIYRRPFLSYDRGNAREKINIYVRKKNHIFLFFFKLILRKEKIKEGRFISQTFYR